MTGTVFGHQSAQTVNSVFTLKVTILPEEGMAPLGQGVARELRSLHGHLLTIA